MTPEQCMADVFAAFEAAARLLESRGHEPPAMLLLAELIVVSHAAANDQSVLSVMRGLLATLYGSRATPPTAAR